MAFIPIHAKADIEGSKKGRLTPAQAAQLNAWCLASKTGILDCLDRCEAETTIYTPVNYVANVVFKRGYVVICGRLVECETGTTVQVQAPVAEQSTGRIILRYNLSSFGTGEFEVTTKEGPFLDSNLIQQDLNDNPLTAIYEFELYSYIATPQSITLYRNGEYVPDIGGKLEQFEKSLKDKGKPLHGYNDNKGTIEERLTNLGFREGSITQFSGIATQNKIYRSGNQCRIEDFDLSGFDVEYDKGKITIGTLPDDFLVKKDETYQCYTHISGYYPAQGTELDTDWNGLAVVSVFKKYISLEQIVVYNPGSNRKMHLTKITIKNFGYEATPIE